MYRKIKIHLLRFICNFPRKSCEPTLDSQSILEPIALARSPTQFPTIVLVVPSWDTAVWMSRKLERKDLVEMTPLTRQRTMYCSLNACNKWSAFKDQFFYSSCLTLYYKLFRQRNKMPFYEAGR